MNLYYKTMQIEITRKCNQSCNHCCRGDSQNIDLSEIVIDAIFDKNNISNISNLTFSGGEPTLNPKGFSYLVEKIIQKNIVVERFCFSINGTIYDEQFVEAINKLDEYCKSKKESMKTCGSVWISDDQFHKPPSMEIVEKYSKLPYFIPYRGMDVLEKKYIMPYGRALDNGLASLDNIDHGKKKSYKLVHYEEQDYKVFDYIYISSNGNFLTHGCMSYEFIDENKMGSVLENDITHGFVVESSQKKDDVSRSNE